MALPLGSENTLEFWGNYYLFFCTGIVQKSANKTKYLAITSSVSDRVVMVNVSFLIYSLTAVYTISCGDYKCTKLLIKHKIQEKITNFQFLGPTQNFCLIQCKIL